MKELEEKKPKEEETVEQPKEKEPYKYRPGTMARLRHTGRKNTGHRYSYMNHFRNMYLGRGSKIDPTTLMSKPNSKATEYSTNDESWSDDKIYPKDNSEQEDVKTSLFMIIQQKIMRKSRTGQTITKLRLRSKILRRVMATQCQRTQCQST
ncbi:hypothetical protein ACH5RR_029055 [Cinchona calisaya]|uniref:Uncharacterized protein n=1 Tax=Cinchona calisaya TaxID=153742 RepID=A0ABD2YQK4_9GENT